MWTKPFDLSFPELTRCNLRWTCFFSGTFTTEGNCPNTGGGSHGNVLTGHTKSDAQPSRNIKIFGSYFIILCPIIVVLMDRGRGLLLISPNELNNNGSFTAFYCCLHLFFLHLWFCSSTTSRRCLLSASQRNTKPMTHISASSRDLASLHKPTPTSAVGHETRGARDTWKKAGKGHRVSVESHAHGNDTLYQLD